MAIYSDFIVDFPMKNGGSFHRFLYVYQRLPLFAGWLRMENPKEKWMMTGMTPILLDTSNLTSTKHPQKKSSPHLAIHGMPRLFAQALHATRALQRFLRQAPQLHIQRRPAPGVRQGLELRSAAVAHGQQHFTFQAL